MMIVILFGLYTNKHLYIFELHLKIIEAYKNGYQMQILYISYVRFNHLK